MGGETTQSWATHTTPVSSTILNRVSNGWRDDPVVGHAHNTGQFYEADRDAVNMRSRNALMPAYGMVGPSYRLGKVLISLSVKNF